MPRVLFVSTVDTTIQAFLLPYARHFRDRGWRVDAMANGILRNQDCQDAFDQLWDVPLGRNPLNPSNFVEAPRRIRAVVAEQGYDIVHVHTPVAAFVVRFALRNRQKQKVIYTAHGLHYNDEDLSLKGRLFRSLEKLAGRWTDYLVLINKDDERSAKRHKFVLADRIRYMPGIGVDSVVYSRQAVSQNDVDAIRHQYGLDPKLPVFVMIAEFNPEKRHHDALVAFSKLQPKAPSYLLFAGVGPLQPEMRQLAIELDVLDRVRFLGFRRDIPALLRLSNGVLLPSQREGLPRCLLEAMSMEVPGIGANTRGTRDLLGQGCGLLHPVGDVETLTEEMLQILTQVEQAAEMGRTGRRLVEQKYELRSIMNMHQVLYEEALKGARD